MWAWLLQFLNSLLKLNPNNSNFLFVNGHNFPIQNEDLENVPIFNVFKILHYFSVQNVQNAWSLQSVETAQNV